MLRAFFGLSVRRHDHLVEGQALGYELDVEPAALARRQRHLLAKRLVADVGAGDGVGAGFEVGERVIARIVRGHAFAGARQHDVGQQQGLF